MTEPNVVRSKRQRIQEDTAGSFFGPLPKRYGRCILSLTYVSLHCDASRPIQFALRSIHTASRLIVQINKDPRSIGYLVQTAWVQPH